MVTGSQFRHHPAIFGMDFHLAEQGVREQSALRVIDRHTGFVAGGFDAKYVHGLKGFGFVQIGEYNPLFTY